jgi:hypothetical protein
MKPLRIKPLPYGKRTAVKANINGTLKYDQINGNLFGSVAVFSESNELCEAFNFKLDKSFTDTWIDDSTVLPAALSILNIEIDPTVIEEEDTPEIESPNVNNPQTETPETTTEENLINENTGTNEESITNSDFAN